MPTYSIGPCGCCGGDCNGYPQAARCLWAGNVSSITDLDEIKNTDWRTDNTVTLPFYTAVTANGLTTLTMAETNQSNWTAYVGNTWAQLVADGYITTHSPLRLRVTIVRCCTTRSTTYYYVSLATGKIDGTNFPPASFDPTKDAIYIELQPFLCPDYPLTAIWTVAANTELYKTATNCLPCAGTPGGVDVTFTEFLEDALPTGSLGECGFFSRFASLSYTPYGGETITAGSLVPPPGGEVLFPEYSEQVCAAADGTFSVPDGFFEGNPDPIARGDTLEDYAEYFFGDFQKCAESESVYALISAGCKCLDHVGFVRGNTSDPITRNCATCGQAHTYRTVTLYLRVYPPASANYEIDLDEIESVTGSRDVRAVAAIGLYWAWGNRVNVANVPCCTGTAAHNHPGSVAIAFNWAALDNEINANYDGNKFRFVERLGQNLSGTLPADALPMLGTGNWMSIALTFCTDLHPDWSAVVDNLCAGGITATLEQSAAENNLNVDFYVAVKK